MLADGHREIIDDGLEFVEVQVLQLQLGVASARDTTAVRPDAELGPLQDAQRLQPALADVVQLIDEL